MSRARNVCFTSFDETEPVYNGDRMDYLVYGKEICPTTGKSHWQGYVELKNQMTYTALSKLMGMDKVHYEPRKGTGEQASTYCKKDGAFKEHGVIKRQGARNDLSVVAEALTDGVALSDVARTFPEQFIKYHTGLKCFKQAIDKQTIAKVQREIKVIILVGPTGCGKTRFAYDNYGDSIYSLSTQREKLWFDNYEGEKCLLLDEFTGGIKLTELLRLLDRYPYLCEIKGSTVYAAWTTVVITSNVPFDQWYPQARMEHKAALMRRVSEVKDFYKVETPVPHPPKK